MPLVNANGVQLHTQSMGEGPPAFMLHGLLTGSLATWYFTAAPTIAQSHKVHLYDLRGHGRSERTTSGYDSQTMVADLAALVDTEAADTIDLVGHSFGALVALRFTLTYPERVRRLALVELPLPPSRIKEVENFLDLSPSEMVAALPQPLQAVVGLQGSGRRARRFLDGLSFLTQSCSLVEDLNREQDISDEALQSIQCPVLGIFGRQSNCAFVADRLAHNVPNFDQVMLEGGHYLHLDAGPRVGESLKGFLNG